MPASIRTYRSIRSARLSSSRSFSMKAIWSSMTRSMNSQNSLSARSLRWPCPSTSEGALRSRSAAPSRSLAARVATRQFAACDEGRYMTRALVQMLQHIVPGDLLDTVPELLMRHFLGDSTADILAIAPGHADQLLIGPIKLLTRTETALTHS